MATSAKWVFHVHANEDAWRAAAVSAIAAALREELALRPRALLLAAGGQTTPVVYRALASTPLEWSRIDVSLIDERWLPHDDTHTNARLLRETLLQDRAREARFVPLVQPGLTIEEAVRLANASTQPACVGVLAMADDGHIASLFPDMAELERIRTLQEAYVAVDARGCPGARGWDLRISSTPAGLMRIPHRILLLRGARKRELFGQSLADGDAHRWPVLFALGDRGGPLHVHWCD